MMFINKLIEEYLEYWMMKFIYCKDIENKNSSMFCTKVKQKNSKLQ